MINLNLPDTALDPKEIELAKAARSSLVKLLNYPDTVNVTVIRQDAAQYEATPVLKLPVKVIRLIAELLDVMSQGQPVAMMKLSQDVTTQEAAEILSVSRPYLIKLLKDRKIPFHLLGKHRRILLDDILKYKTDRRAASVEHMLEERISMANSDDAVWHDADSVFGELDAKNAG